MVKLNPNAIEFIQNAQQKYGYEAVITRDQIRDVVDSTGCSYPYFFITNKDYRYGKNTYRLPNIGTSNPIVQNQVPEEVSMTAQVLALRQPKLVDESQPTVPELHPDYVKFGFFNDLRNIIDTNMFYPVFITGLSGNGKTLMVEQVCATLRRECIRVAISIETDETDLLGGHTLIDGNTVYRDGPVLQAMKRGTVLLLDEVDRGSNKLMCLQGILEGKPYYNKKTGEVVHPANGFTVVATANTKGRGSEEGRYLSQILDDAFLERFPITVEQEYPDVKTEKKILKPLIDDEEFVDLLIKWADVVRQSFEQGAVDEIISTRRLVHIAKAFKIFKNRMKAIQLCVNRFDEDTKNAFMDLYSKVDVKVQVPVEEDKTDPFSTEEVPF
jgi:MoxR-like ATPase